METLNLTTKKIVKKEKSQTKTNKKTFKKSGIKNTQVVAIFLLLVGIGCILVGGIFFYFAIPAFLIIPVVLFVYPIWAMDLAFENDDDFLKQIIEDLG